MTEHNYSQLNIKDISFIINTKAKAVIVKSSR